MCERDQLPSAVQEAGLRAPYTSVIFNNLKVIIVNTKEGPIMLDGMRTTITGNTTKIESSTGNFAVASSDVTQIKAEGIDVEKVQEFAKLITEISPILGLTEDEQGKLQSGALELRTAANDPASSKGRVQRALDRVMKVLRGAGETAARGIAIGVGDELMRELGSGIMGQSPH